MQLGLELRERRPLAAGTNWYRSSNGAPVALRGVLTNEKGYPLGDGLATPGRVRQRGTND
jgi:hypothetical protein